MNIRRFGVLSATLASLALAQEHNPVPTRLSIEPYGASAVGGELGLVCELDDPTTSRIEVRGGGAGKSALILVATRPAHIALPWGGTLLVAPDAVPVYGTFDARGAFALPVDVALAEFVGSTVYFQGVEFDPAAPTMITVSHGLALTFVAGNVQPPLSYVGPPQTVVFCKTEGAVHTYGLLAQVRAPRLGYALTEVSRQTTAGTTRVFLRVLEPAAATGWQLDNKRLYLGLGENVGTEIEVWIAIERNGDPSPPVFGLAALVQRVF
jgi:hypothetical protein